MIDLFNLMHLIPLCQYHVLDGSVKISFERQVDSILLNVWLTLEEKISLFETLLSHPSNYSFQQNLVDHEISSPFPSMNNTHCGTEQHQSLNVRWEVICFLMRNIVCHEVNFNWQNVQYLVSKLKHANLRNNFDLVWEKVIEIYWETVFRQKLRKSKIKPDFCFLKQNIFNMPNNRRIRFPK